jgi:hypothetical protein
MEILKALKTHPNAVAWKFNNDLGVSLNMQAFVLML